MAATKNHIALAFLIALALAKLAILFWSVDKGLEMTDEGYYLLWFKSAHLYPPDMHLNYYYLVQTFFGWVHWDVVAMRIGGIVTELGAMAALVWGLCKYLKHRLPHLYTTQLAIWFVVGGLAVLFTAEHPRSLSYDSITHLLMSVGGGLILWWLAMEKQATMPKTIIAFTLLGYVLAAQLIVKFSSVILLVGLWAVVVWWVKKERKQLVVPVVSVFGGMVLTFAAIFLFQISLPTFLEYYRISYERITGLGYSPLNIIVHTYLAKDVVHFAISTGPALLAFLFVWFASKPHNHPKRIAASLTVMLGVWLCQAILLPTNYFPQWHFQLIDLMLLLIFTGTFIIWRLSMLNKHWMVLLLVLFSLPFVCAIGSAINWAMSLFSFLPAWVLLILLIWGAIGKQVGTASITALVRYGAILASFAVFMQVFIWPDYLPHGMAAPMYHQTISPVTHDRVKLDPPTAKFVTETKQMLASHGFVPGNYILALYDLPGLVYLLEGYSPEVPWYFGETTRATTEEALNNACWHIGNITSTNVFVVKPATIHPDVSKCLSFSKLNFPASYTLAGTVYNTYSKCEMEVWAPKQ